MQFYCHTLPEPLGTDNRLIFRDLKTLRGAINRCNKVFGTKDYVIKSFTNFYDEKTFKILFMRLYKRG